MIKIKLNVAMRGHLKDKIILVETDKRGQPKDNFWARRLKDSQTDNCIEIVTSKKSPKKKVIDND